VRCKQPHDAKLPPLPRADEWVTCYPPLPGAIDKKEACVPSEKNTLWVEAAAVVVDKLRGWREVEHTCLDDAEKKGLIQQ
jgi:hypothetical protein